MDVLMPQLGETVTEGTVSQWFKSVGDKVAAGEPLFEIETDKTSMEVEATSSGILSEIRVAEGEAAPVGAAVAVIQSGDAPVEAAAAEVPAKEQLKRESALAATTPAGAMDPYREVATPTEDFGPAKAGSLRVTPLARRIASRDGIDLSALAVRLAQSGARRIAKADVEAFARSGGAPAAAPRPVPAGETEIIELNRIRRATAQHLARSWAEVPHVFQAVEAQFHRVARARARLNEDAERQGGVKVTYLAFVARAACLAIRSYPFVNAHMDGERLIVHHAVHLGIAVDLDHEGLVVPVIRNAEGLNVVGLARAVREASERARAGKLTEDDLAGGTFTISNSGSLGTLMTAPIINQPQVAILSSDGVAKRPVAVEDEDGEHIAIRPVGIVGQSFDHRAFDGAYSAAFLGEIKRIVETRDWFSEAEAGG